jgi:putative NADH-flavin reductase
VVSFTPEMAHLYEAGHTWIDLEQRRALGRNSLAKWLHGHYASHANPFPYKVEKLRELTASGTSDIWKFRQLLKKAHDALIAVGAIKSWSIDPKTDLVEVTNAPSQTQLKHLAKKKGKR